MLKFYKLYLPEPTLKEYKYFISTSPEIFIKKILNDSRGWRKYKYKFKQIDRINDPRVIKMKFTNDAGMEKLYGKDFMHLSVYDKGINTITFNMNNWLDGGKSEMEIKAYRTYVINHEVGHALGIMKHPDCPFPEGGKPASVMQQMTKGPVHIKPCLPNCWPLDPRIYNEFTQTRNIQGGTDVRCSIL